MSNDGSVPAKLIRTIGDLRNIIKDLDDARIVVCTEYVVGNGAGISLNLYADNSGILDYYFFIITKEGDPVPMVIP